MVWEDVGQQDPELSVKENVCIFWDIISVSALLRGVLKANQLSGFWRQIKDLSLSSHSTQEIILILIYPLSKHSSLANNALGLKVSFILECVSSFYLSVS